MAKYRNQLPHLAGAFFLAAGGLETVLMFEENIELPYFAAFHAMKTEKGLECMKNYYRNYIKLAQRHNVGIILESSTWRASPDWLRKIGYTDYNLFSVNNQAVELINDVCDQCELGNLRIVIDGCIGPRGDGYSPTVVMTADEAKVYHAAQIDALSRTKADIITAYTLTYPEEAIGIALAAKEVHMPIAISFTIELDGKLPTGQTLKEAIEIVDQATQNGPLYYLVNCIHPIYLENAMNEDGSWKNRIRGIKGNASKKSHTELDQSTELDSGDPIEFSQINRELINKFKHLNIIGGCCGTSETHLEETYKACVDLFK